MGFSKDDLKFQKEKFAKAGQGHIFDLYEHLGAYDQQVLMKEATALDPEQINLLYKNLVVEMPGSTEDSDS